ncbi:MAG: hypothetical protein V4631_10105 [Pseudomonadota bacterium]
MPIPETCRLCGVAALLVLAACKPSTEAAAPVQDSPQASVAAASAPAPPVTAAPSNGQAPDLSKFAQSSALLPPFPYFQYPASISPGFRFGSDHALFDQTAVIVGKQLYLIEGRYQILAFPTKDAGLTRDSALAHYSQAIKAMGAVKVNDITPDDPAFQAAHADTSAQLDKQLRTQGRSTYDAYLVRNANTTAWIILMISDERTRIVAIEQVAAPSSVRFIQATAP